ncbi:hypothetical protein BDZ97DRAFT_1840735 [Flammula alnicola]|nr:hypothetical protein BDZ97DRAFT_1840735 [Flammula alnicola]
MMDGDGEIKWGPHARTIQRAWMEEAAAAVLQPLSRALDTCDIMLNKVFSEHLHPVLILEVCAISRHRTIRQFSDTCDKCRTRSYISHYKPHFAIEERFEEYDQLRHPTIQETKAEVARRAGKVLGRIFETDTEHTFISITAHGGFINGFLTAIGWRPFPLPTGGVMSVLVKASTLQMECGSALSFFWFIPPR